MIRIQSVSEAIGYDFNKYNKLKVNSEDGEKVEFAANFLLETMEKALKAEEEIVKLKKKANRLSKQEEGIYRYSKPEKATQQGYFSFFYQSNYENEYFFNESPLSKKVVEYLIEREKVKYVGRIEHQGTPHKAWTVQDDDNVIDTNLKLRNELKDILSNMSLRKEIIKSAIVLKLQFGGDYFIDWLLEEKKFEIFIKGELDWVVFNGKNKLFLLDNVNELFLSSVNELVKEELIRTNNTNQIFCGRKFIKKNWTELENDIAYNYIFSEKA